MRISQISKAIVGAAGFAAIAGAVLSVPVIGAGSLIPALNTHDFYGYGSAKVSDATVSGEPFKTAVTITNAAPGKNPWDSGAATATLTGKVAKGDRLAATFYVRALSPASAKIELSIELSNAPYTSSGRKTISATKSWKKVTVPGVAVDNYPGSQIHVVFHTAFAKETMQVAGLTLVDKGK